MASVASTIGWAVAILFVVDVTGTGGTGLPGIILACRLLSLAAKLILLMGIWKITAPASGQAGEDKLLSPGTIARVGFLIYFVLVSLPSRLPMSLLQISSLIGNAMYAVALIALCLHMRRLALLVPDRELAGWTRPFIWLLVLVQGTGLARHALVVVARWGMAGATTGSAGSSIVVVLRAQAWVSRIGGLLLAVAAFVLIMWYHRVLRLAASQAWFSGEGASVDPGE